MKFHVETSKLVLEAQAKTVEELMGVQAGKVYDERKAYIKIPNLCTIDYKEENGVVTNEVVIKDEFVLKIYDFIHNHSEGIKMMIDGIGMVITSLEKMSGLASKAKEEIFGSIDFGNVIIKSDRTAAEEFTNMFKKAA